MERYEKPEMEIIEFDAENIITGSDGTRPIDYGSRETPQTPNAWRTNA